MSDPIVPPDYWVNVKAILQLFYPQYFDPANPAYVPPEMLDALLPIADEARPWCLSEERQNFAEAMFLAYLISVQKETSAGKVTIPYAGPITSEKEGDIAITYAASAIQGQPSLSKRPSSDPWDAWNRMWSVCMRGAITTRFGDPCQQSSIRIMGGVELTWMLRSYVVGL